MQRVTNEETLDLSFGYLTSDTFLCCIFNKLEIPSRICHSAYVYTYIFYRFSKLKFPREFYANPSCQFDARSSKQRELFIFSFRWCFAIASIWYARDASSRENEARTSIKHDTLNLQRRRVKDTKRGKWSTGRDSARSFIAGKERGRQVLKDSIRRIEERCTLEE